MQASGGLRYDSQGAGAPNTLSGYFFLPISQEQTGSLLFVDGFGSWNYGSELSDNNFGASSRIGYRWLDKPRTWLFGLNGGIDTTPYSSSYYWQAGVGAEALSRKLEARINGYIPLGDTNEFVSSGIYNAYLASNKLYLNAYENWTSSFGGAELEVGVPLARWKGGSLWGYSGYYLLDAAVADGPNSSGYKGRAEVRLGTNLALGATFTYDNIFYSRGLGYISYGTRPVGFSAKAAVQAGEAQFFANRGLPVSRERDVRISQVTIDKPNTVAINPSTGRPWTIRCVGVTSNGSSCSYSDLTAAAIAGSSDVILLANGSTSNLNGNQLNLPAGVTLSSTNSAPSLRTQYGSANLSSFFWNNSTGTAPAVTNGIIGIGSGTTISGIAFTDTTITNYSTSNVLISGNTFTRSYSPDPTGINSSARPAIDFNGANNVTIAGNTFTDPAVKSFIGTDGVTTYLSGRAVSLTDSAGITIANNTISGSLGEGIGLDNATGNISVTGNMVSGMKEGPDTNLVAGIFIRNDSGEATLTIEGNTVKDNTPYRLRSDGTADTSVQNASDGIEINLCRGSSFAANDQFTDGLYGTCASAAIITATVKNNTVANILGAGDGLDMNVGTSGSLSLTATGNTVTNAGDEAFTLDMRGNAVANVTIASNILQTANTKWSSGTTVGNSNTDGIAITIANDDASGASASGTSNFKISSNTIGVTSPTAGDKAEGIKIELFGTTPQTDPINLIFDITYNTVSSPNGDVVELATPTSGGYTDASNSITANIWGNTLNKTASGSADDGFKFTSNIGATFRNILSIKDNVFNINGSNTSSTYAAIVTQDGGGALYTLFAGNSSLVNTTSNKTIVMNEGAGASAYNVGSPGETSANNNGMIFSPSAGVDTVTQLP